MQEGQQRITELDQRPPLVAAIQLGIYNVLNRMFDAPAEEVHQATEVGTGQPVTVTRSEGWDRITHTNIRHQIT